eukprot:86815-Pyramimonas_sp.AAC.1
MAFNAPRAASVRSKSAGYSAFLEAPRCANQSAHLLPLVKTRSASLSAAPSDVWALTSLTECFTGVDLTYRQCSPIADLPSHEERSPLPFIGAAQSAMISECWSEFHSAMLSAVRSP